jgi:WD40 repeat protein
MRLTPAVLIVVFHQHVEIWDIPNGTPRQKLETAVNVYAPCAVSNDFALMAVAGKDQLSLAVATPSGSDLRPLRAADDTVSMTHFSRDGKFLAAVSIDGRMVRVFETQNLLCIGRFKRGNTTTMIHSVDFSPKGDFFAIISQNGTIHFFDLRNKPPTKSPPTIPACQKISVGQSCVGHLMWGEPGLLSVMIQNAEGQLLNIAIDEQNCREVGREQILVVRRVQESDEGGDGV